MVNEYGAAKNNGGKYASQPKITCSLKTHERTKSQN